MLRGFRVTWGDFSFSFTIEAGEPRIAGNLERGKPVLKLTLFQLRVLAFTHLGDVLSDSLTNI